MFFRGSRGCTRNRGTLVVVRCSHPEASGRPMAWLMGGAESVLVCHFPCSPRANWLPSSRNRLFGENTLSRGKQHFKSSPRPRCLLVLPELSSRKIEKRLRCLWEKVGLVSAFGTPSRLRTIAARSCIGRSPANLAAQCRGEGSNTGLALPGRGGLGFIRVGGWLPRWRCCCWDEADGADEVVKSMRRLLDGKPSKATKAATDLVTSIDQQGRAALLSALFSCVSHHCAAAVQFKEADTKGDGVLDEEEFTNYVEAQEIKHGLSSKPLTKSQIFNLAVRAAIGMVGFGFVDNAVMIIAGDAIEHSIGSTFGLSTLTSAGLGNTASDLLGTAFCGYIEGATSPFMPKLSVSSVQMTFKEAWWAETIGSSLGITLGCFLGLLPLVFIKESGSGSGFGPYPTSPRPSTMVSDKFAKSRGKRSRSISTNTQFEDMKWCSTSGFETLSPFASVSSSADSAPSSSQRIPCNQVGRSFLFLAITVFMALKRLSERGKHLRRRTSRPHVGKDIEMR